MGTDDPTTFARFSFRKIASTGATKLGVSWIASVAVRAVEIGTRLCTRDFVLVLEEFFLRCLMELNVFRLGSATARTEFLWTRVSPFAIWTSPFEMYVT
jgi:hypothetical protein